MSGSTNPAVYYSDEALHGSYIRESLENIVNNFISTYTGDDKTLGVVARSNIIYWAKSGIREFTFSALQDIKKVELSLGDTLDVILPPDFVNLVRISWLDTRTGMFRPMSENRKFELATSYLQDFDAFILFDNDGNILEGTSETEIINNDLSALNANNSLTENNITCYRRCYDDTLWNLDTSQNFNGTFNIDPNKKRIHFGSNNASDTIILEYISDGLEFSNESNISIHKFAISALHAYINYQLLDKKEGIQEYIIRRAKDTFYREKRNATIKLMGIRIAELTQSLKQNNRWFK